MAGAGIFNQPTAPAPPQTLWQKGTNMSMDIRKQTDPRNQEDYYVVLEDSQPKKHMDPQTKEDFFVVLEDNKATRAARLTGVYLIVMAGIWLGLLFDVWSGSNHLIRWIARQCGIETDPCLDCPAFRLVAYSLIGGGIGGVLSGFRSLIFWHCEMGFREKGAFGSRFGLKHIIYPIQGALLGLIVYVLLRSGVAMLDGQKMSDTTGSLQALSFLGIGALAGYGAQSVFRWLDHLVNRVFKFDRNGKDDEQNGNKGGKSNAPQGGAGNPAQGGQI